MAYERTCIAIRWIE